MDSSCFSITLWSKYLLPFTWIIRSLETSEETNLHSGSPENPKNRLTSRAFPDKAEVSPRGVGIVQLPCGFLGVESVRTRSKLHKLHGWLPNNESSSSPLAALSSHQNQRTFLPNWSFPSGVTGDLLQQINTQIHTEVQDRQLILSHENQNTAPVLTEENWAFLEEGENYREPRKTGTPYVLSRGVSGREILPSVINNVGGEFRVNEKWWNDRWQKFNLTEMWGVKKRSPVWFGHANKKGSKRSFSTEHRIREP